MKFRPTASILVLSLFVAWLAPAQAGLVNGSFESGSFTFDGNGAASLAPGSTAISGWTTFGAELAVIKNANSFGLLTPFGDNFLDLTGYHDSSPYGGVQQSVATVVGLTYDLTLYLGVNNSLNDGFGPISVLVTAGAASATLTANPTGPGDIWTLKTFSFVASSATTLIMIQGSSTANGRYIGLDNVALSDGVSAVPEPASLTLCGIGVVCLVGFIRGRRVKSLTPAA